MRLSFSLLDCNRPSFDVSIPSLPQYRYSGAVRRRSTEDRPIRVLYALNNAASPLVPTPTPSIPLDIDISKRDNDNKNNLNIASSPSSMPADTAGVVLQWAEISNQPQLPTSSWLHQRRRMVDDLLKSWHEPSNGWEMMASNDEWRADLSGAVFTIILRPTASSARMIGINPSTPLLQMARLIIVDGMEIVETLSAGCIPVIIADDYILPFADVIVYSPCQDRISFSLLHCHAMMCGMPTIPIGLVTNSFNIP
jgi:hypothetical protein